MYRHRLLLTLGRAQLFQPLDDLLLINLHHLLQILIVLQMHLEIEQMLGHPGSLQWRPLSRRREGYATGSTVA